MTDEGRSDSRPTIHVCRLTGALYAIDAMREVDRVIVSFTRRLRLGFARPQSSTGRVVSRRSTARQRGVQRPVQPSPVIADEASITDKSVLFVVVSCPAYVLSRHGCPEKPRRAGAARGTGQRADAAGRRPATASSPTTRHRARNLNVNCN